MRNLVLVLLTGLFSLTIYGQDITGHWNGILTVHGTQLRLVFNIEKIDNNLTSTLDSPDQGAFGIPSTNTTFENSTLRITIANAKIEYEGKLGNDTLIEGSFKQAGHLFELKLSKKITNKNILVRPQEPNSPYPYYFEDVTFENKSAGISFAGTLTLPFKDGVFPVVILISGSGPQNRDGELLGHKPFLVLSDYLTKNGIAVLRYDDRGTAFSKGEFTSATSEDFATDVEAGIEYLKTRKEINKKEIGLIGHSEGGIIAPMVASKSKDVAFIILLAGPGIQGDQLLLLQQKLICKVKGFSEEYLRISESTNRKIFDIVKKSNSLDQLDIDLTNYITNNLKDFPKAEQHEEINGEDFVKLQVKHIATPWMQYFIKYNPFQTLTKVKCPVFALNGEKDLQVPPKENLNAINIALKKGGNKQVMILELPNLNHLFQECITGAPDEYYLIEQTFSPTAMKEILKWIKIQTR